MKKENLLIDCNITAIKERLKITLGNIDVQKGFILWDDIEKIEHCVAALEILEEEEKEIKNLEFQARFQLELGNVSRASTFIQKIEKIKNN